MISDDLVNSYHLLLCALDLVYGNALQCPNHKELLNPNFKGVLGKKSLYLKSAKTLRLLKWIWTYVVGRIIIFSVWLHSYYATLVEI